MAIGRSLWLSNYKRIGMAIPHLALWIRPDNKHLSTERNKNYYAQSTHTHTHTHTPITTNNISHHYYNPETHSKDCHTKHTQKTRKGHVLFTLLVFVCVKWCLWCCAFCFVRLRLVFCVPNVASFSELSILAFPFGYLLRYYMPQ